MNKRTFTGGLLAALILLRRAGAGPARHDTPTRECVEHGHRAAPPSSPAATNANASKPPPTTGRRLHGVNNTASNPRAHVSPHARTLGGLARPRHSRRRRDPRHQFRPREKAALGAADRDKDCNHIEWRPDLSNSKSRPQRRQGDGQSGPRALGFTPRPPGAQRWHSLDFRARPIRLNVTARGHVCTRALPSCLFLALAAALILPGGSSRRTRRAGRPERARYDALRAPSRSSLNRVRLRSITSRCKRLGLPRCVRDSRGREPDYTGTPASGRRAAFDEGIVPFCKNKRPCSFSSSSAPTCPRRLANSTGAVGLCRDTP